MRLQVLLCAAALALAGCAADRDAHYSEAGTDPAAHTQSSGARALTGQDLPAPLAAGDAQFLRQAAQSGRAETRIGRLLLQSAADDSLREFGRGLIEHQSQRHTALAALAEKKGLPLPSRMAPTQKARLTRLAKMSGEKLERASEQMALDLHVRSLQTYKVAAQRAQDPEVKAFAQSQIPLLEEHLIQAHRLVQGIGGTAGSEGAESE